jgi:hypothetical protein
MMVAMRRRRTRITIAIVAAILLLLAAAVYLRAKAPPEVARLLPESDGIVYLNLAPLRAATHFDRTSVPPGPEYQKFIHATGIVVERDLNQVAFALQRMPSPNGPNGPVAYSEVFEGHFDGRRLTKYLAGIATAKENYAGHTIYDIPNDGRTDRVTLLGYDMVAVSNTPTAEQIHSIVDRYRTAAMPFTGSSLLAAHYKDVPLLSLAWGIGKIGLPLGGEEQQQIQLLGMALPISPDATFVASLRWTGALRLCVEEIAQSMGEATSSANALKTILGAVHVLESTPAGIRFDANMKQVLDSARVRQKKNRVILTASIPDALLKAMLKPPPPQPAATPAPPVPAPAAPVPAPQAAPAK